MRKPRVKKEGAIYHTTARINRQEMALLNKAFKNLLLQVILEAKRKYPFNIRNFCIMGNHIHMEIEPLEGQDLSKIMQWILSIFARRYNKEMNYKGHVWYDRFKSKIIETMQQYINTFFYIAANPVRAGMVNHPLKFAYNGISYYKNNKDPGFLTPVFKWMEPLIKKFLKEFHVKNYQETNIYLSFRDKKPGRQKKKK